MLVDWSELECDLDPDPEFYVEPPDGRTHLSEINRQVAFRRIMYMAAPRVMLYANANAGKRNPLQAKAEGIVAGVFDMTAVWKNRVAWIEFKGYSGKKRRRAGVLSRQQIEFGNRLVQLEQPCACFFDEVAAANWLREQGFPVGTIKATN